MTQTAAAKQRIFVLLSIYVFCQPFLDLITSFQKQADQTLTIGTVVRSLFMVICFFYVMKVSFKHKYYFPLISSIAIALYCVLFLIVCFFRGDLSTAFGNVREVIKLFYFPFVLCSFFVVYKEYGSFVDMGLLAKVSVIYMAVIFVAFITGTGFVSYDLLDLGNKGWFHAANEIGAIIGILSPFTIVYYSDVIVARREGKWRWIAYVIAVISLGLVAFCSVFIGTKAVFFSIAGYLICYFGWYVIHSFMKKRTSSDRRHVLLTVGVFVAIALLYFVSPLRENINGVMKYQYHNAITDTSSISSAASELPTGQSEIERPDTAEGNSAVSGSSQIQESASESQQIDMQERIQSSYGYKMMNWLLSDRLDYALPTIIAYIQGDISVKLFGVGYVAYDAASPSIEKSMEMDFLTVFFRHGIIGAIIYLVPLFYFLFVIIKAAFVRFKKAWNSIWYCTGLYSILLGLGIAFFAGHVLTAPAVSIYIALIIVMLIGHIEKNILVRDKGEILKENYQ